MSAYSILGLSENCSWKDVRKNYKQMIVKVHPDKMNGSVVYFDLVQRAYEELKATHINAKEYSNLPKDKVQYTTQSDIVSPQKMKKFTNKKFNKFFEENKILDNNNPFLLNGYGQYMSSSLNYTEDIDIAKNKKIYQPSQKLVVYKEPESLNSSNNVFGNCSTLGVNEIKDFSGGGGTDIMKAYSEPLELIDTVKKYKNIQDLQAHRGSENLQATDSELKRLKKQEEKRAKLEQLRMNTLFNNNQLTSEKYINLNRRLK
jgi:curved DNA-binding protein CbpA